MRYCVYSMKVPTMTWHESKEKAIAAFERRCKKFRIAPPLHYPPQVSGDFVSTNGIAYPQHKCLAGPRDGHGFVYIDSTNERAQ